MVAVVTLYSVANGGARAEFGVLAVRDRDGVRNGADEFGSVRARELNEYPTRAWELVWDEATLGQVLFVEHCFDLSLGGVLGMTFTPYGDVDANALEVGFVRDVFETDQVSPVRWRMRSLIEELR